MKFTVDNICQLLINRNTQFQDIVIYSLFIKER